jgi:hypothetical protein
MICWFENQCNNIGNNDSGVYFVSSQSSSSHGLFVYKSNFRLSIALYIARNRDIIQKGFEVNDKVYLSYLNCVPR